MGLKPSGPGPATELWLHAHTPQAVVQQPAGLAPRWLAPASAVAWPVALQGAPRAGQEQGQSRHLVMLTRYTSLPHGEHAHGCSESNNLLPYHLELHPGSGLRRLLAAAASGACGSSASASRLLPRCRQGGKPPLPYERSRKPTAIRCQSSSIRIVLQVPAGARGWPARVSAVAQLATSGSFAQRRRARETGTCE